MTNIDLKPYIQDTLINLETLLEKISKTGINFLDYKNYLANNYVALDNKKVIFIGGAQISGSASPFIHTYSSFVNNNPFSYILFDMTKNNTNLNDIFNFVNQEENILGGNISMPYKIEIFKLVQNVGSLHDSAKLLGAVNTLAKIDGKLIGLNTDLFGIYNPIQKKLGENIKGIKKGYVLGAGGAARAAVGALLKLGIKDIIVFNRSENTLKELLNHFNSKEISSVIGSDFNISIIKYDQEDIINNSIAKHIDSKGILINTLPIGFNDKLSTFPISETEFDLVFSNIDLYFDIVYNINKKDTPMSMVVKEKYPKVLNCNGIDMVITQAQKGFEMWSNGDTFSEEKIKEILKLR